MLVYTVTISVEECFYVLFHNTYYFLVFNFFASAEGENIAVILFVYYFYEIQLTFSEVRKS